MNILVLGGGGREHALATSLATSPKSDTVYVAPGNGGRAYCSVNVDLDLGDHDQVVEFARAHDVKLVVIGPEAPLVAGLADAVRAEGIDCFGPDAKGARMEGSKKYAKDFMKKYDIPTAAYQTFDSADSALRYLEMTRVPVVVKADGLAAGKGVVVAQTREEAKAAVRDCFKGLFGPAGKTIVIEECMSGPECTLLAFCDGQTIIPMVPSQDHKRALDGDKGPNTGGMGVYSPVPIVTDEEYEKMLAIMRKTAHAMAAEGIVYRGCLYGGFMLTDNGPRVLEYNVRFGDPEAQVVLPRLKTDLVDVMVKTARGNLAGTQLEWDDRWAVCVVLTSGGYPRAYETGKVITGVADAEAIEGVTVYHAGTDVNEDGDLVTAGGRVLDVTALGDTFEDARVKAYEAVSKISFDGMAYRTDIGERALKGRSAWK